MLCSGRGRMELGGWIWGEGRALVINRYSRHSEKLTEIYDVQIYGGKQKGRDRKTGKDQASDKWREERRDGELGLLYQWRERGLGSIVHRLRARAGLPLGGPYCSVAWAIKFFILHQRIIFSCEATVVFIKPWAHSSMTTWAPCCSSTTRSHRPRSRSHLSISFVLFPVWDAAGRKERRSYDTAVGLT